MGKVVDLTGQRFGRLLVIGRAGKNKYGKSLWHCLCDCGNQTDVMVSALTGGRTISCGCYHRETFKNSTHGGSGTRLYRIWCGMRERCTRTGSTNYKWYGAKGIKVCPEWSAYERFREWAITHGYSDNLTIDRINPSLGYSPENCRWITRQENASLASKTKRKMVNANV